MYYILYFFESNFEILASRPKAVTAADGAPMDLDRAIFEVLKYAMQVGGVVKGLREVCKGLDRCEAHFCILAEDCDEENYATLVEALAFEHDISLLKVCIYFELFLSS